MGGGLLFLQLLLGTIAVVFCNLNCPTINALPVQICSATITWMRGENKFKSYIIRVFLNYILIRIYNLC